MDKYLDRYRTESTRLQNWDYRWPASYFITLCTQTREHYFGKIVPGIARQPAQCMQLSPVGVIADFNNNNPLNWTDDKFFCH